MNLEVLIIYFLLIVFPFGQLTKIPLNIDQVNIYFHDFLIMLILIIWLIRQISLKRKFLISKLNRYILGFIIITAFSLTINISSYKFNEILIAFLYLARWLIYAGIYFVIADLSRQNLVFKKNVYDLLIIATVSAAILGLLQYIYIPDIRPLAAFAWDPHYYRIVGTYLDPGFTSMIYVLGIILIVLRSWKDKKNLILKLSFLITYIALALTYSRSGYLAYIIAMLIIAFKKKAVMFMIVVFLTGIITLLTLPRPGGEGVKLERQSTIRARIINWQQTLKIYSQKPLFGWGFNGLRYVQRDLGLISNNDWEQTHSGSGTDSSLLFVLATTGIIGLIIYLYLMVNIIKLSYQRSLLIFSSFCSLIIHSFFNNSLFYNWILIWGWMILGLNFKLKDNN